MGAPTPAFLPKAFGALAVDPTYINTIPTSTVTPGRASFNLGFPPLTMTPIIAGGVPPFGQDVNGILYMLSTHAFASQAGQPPLYSSDISTAISGYALGTVLGSTDGSTLWFNIVAGNVTDPDGGSSAGWIPLTSYGITTVSGVTGGTTTLTPAQARKSVLLLTGALVSNAAVVLPNWVGLDWLIANATTGAFTVTVRTAAGSGVVVPQGGFAEPVGVYGDGTNLYPTITPLDIPTSEGPVPNTYALRTAAGYLLATYFNMSGAADNEALTNVIYDLGDGFLRRMSQANFRAQLFANAALTGTPTAPTAAVGTNDTTIASTAFVQAAVGGATIGGYVPSNGVGAIISAAGWTASRLGLGQYLISYDAPIPNGLFMASVVTPVVGSPMAARVESPGLTGFIVRTFGTNDNPFDSAFMFHSRRIA